MRPLFTILIILSACKVHAQLYYPSQGTWEVKSALGFDQKLLEDAINFARENEYSGSRDLRIAILEGFSSEPYHEIEGPVRHRGGPAGLIIKDGYIVASWGDPSRVDMTFSVTKSYVSTLAGLAIKQGLIRSVHDSVASYVWDGTYDGQHNSGITWDHLLTQSSDWSGELFGMHDWADRPPREGGIDEWKFRKLNEPGSVFEYNDVRVNLLAYSLLQVFRKPLPQVLKEQVMDPVGASTTWRWFGYDNSWVNIDGTQVQSVTGGGHSGGGIFISTYDHARFGLLFARKGKWKEQEIISQPWIGMATTPSAAQENYGYMWWLLPDNLEGVPSGLFYAAGFGGNYIIADQENDLVIVTRWLAPSRLNDFVQQVYQALR